LIVAAQSRCVIRVVVMGKNWLDISTPAKRARLSWIGGGIVAVAAGTWAVVTYIWPAHGGKGGINCATNASIAAQGDVRNNTINADGATLRASGTDCGNSATR
jgi:hypothetical protein